MKSFNVWRAVIAGVVLVLLSSKALAAAEVALITLVQGEVQLSEGAGKAIPAVPFVKMRAGTRVSVAENGRFQLVYLGSGRQETWAANSQIEVGEAESKAFKVTKLPAVKQLPLAILKGLTQAPMMIADMRSRQGMIRVRSMSEMARIEEAEKNYKALRGQSEPDDVTPELFLLATLSELKHYDKMKQPLDSMLGRQPGNEDIRALHDAYMKQIAGR